MGSEHWYDIDPTVWMTMTDGRIVLGQPHTYCVKLNEDMISTRARLCKWTHRRLSGRTVALVAQNAVLRSVTTGIRLYCCPRNWLRMSKSPTGLGSIRDILWTIRPYTRNLRHHRIQGKGFASA